MTNQPTIEHRRHRRQRVLKDGKICFGKSTVIDVVVRDLSSGGARLKVPVHVAFPDTFNLQIGPEKQLHPVEVRWRSGEQMGIAFIDGLNRPAAPPPIPNVSLAHVTPPEALRPLPDPETLEYGSGPVTQSFLLPEFRLKFELAEGGRGDCLVDIRLYNAGTLTAHHPFLCIPVMGFDLRPAASCAMREIAGLRRMLRFARVHVTELRPGDTIHCCTMVLPFMPGAGGWLQYAPGAAHRLGDLPDIKLVCVAGAANYSPQRLPIVVPGAQLAAVTARQAVAPDIKGRGPAY